MDLAALAATVTANPSLHPVPFDQFLLFLASIAPLKNDILLLQPSDHLPDDAPEVLPRSVLAFLSQACSLPTRNIQECWSTFKDIAWHSNDALSPSLHCIPLMFHKHGLQHGLSRSPRDTISWR